MKALIEQYKSRFKVILIPMDETDKKRLSIFRDLTMNENSPAGEVHLDVAIIKPRDEDNKQDDEYKFTQF